MVPSIYIEYCCMLDCSLLHTAQSTEHTPDTPSPTPNPPVRCGLTGGCLYFHTLSSVRPSPLPTAASRKAAERPRAVSRVELSVVESRSNSFRRSPEHLWPCRPCRQRQGQTCTHDSRDDLLQSRAVRTTRSTGWSNSTSGQFVRFAPCDLGVAAQHLVSSSAAVQ